MPKARRHGNASAERGHAPIPTAHRLRSHGEKAAAEQQAAAAARSDGVNIQLRRLYGNPGYCGFEHVLVSPSEAADVGAGAAHVEPNHLDGFEQSKSLGGI